MNSNSAKRTIRINLFAFTVAAASLVTSLTTLLTIPNGLMHWYHKINWEKNVNVIRVNTNDYTYIYNGNPESIFVDRMEVVSGEVGKLHYIEIGKTVPAESYLVFMHKGIAYTEMHAGHVNSLKMNGVLPATFEMITITKDYPFEKLLSSVSNSHPTYYDSVAKIYINMGSELHVVSLKTKSFIVKKALEANAALRSDSSFEQPRILCDYKPKDSKK